MADTQGPSPTDPTEEISTPASRAGSLISTDFAKLYDVYMFHIRNRAEAIKLYVRLAIAPFLILSAFGVLSEAATVSASLSAAVIARSSQTEARPQPATPQISPKAPTLRDLMHIVPADVFYLFIIFSYLGLVPFHQFCNAHGQSYKMIRFLNGFRLLYSKLLRSEFKRLKWFTLPDISVEGAPRPFEPFHWTTFVSLGMLLTNAAFFVLGAKFSDPIIADWSAVHWISVIVLGIILFAFHWYFFHSEVIRWESAESIETRYNRVMANK